MGFECPRVDISSLSQLRLSNTGMIVVMEAVVGFEYPRVRISFLSQLFLFNTGKVMVMEAVIGFEYPHVPISPSRSCSCSTPTRSGGRSCS